VAKCPADDEAEAIIRDRLEAAFPDDAIIGEELTHRDRPRNDPSQRLWLLDPNDGTSSMQEGWRGASVSIALVRGDRPVLGVVFAYSAPDDDGDLIAWALGSTLTRNGQPYERPPWPERAGPTVVYAVSQAVDHKSRANIDLAAPARVRAVPGIAYRLALAATGDADLAVSLGNPNDYDCAAGHALLLGTGADLHDLHGHPQRYADRWHAVNVLGGPRSLVEPLTHRAWTRVFERATPEPGPAELNVLCWPSKTRHERDAAVLRRAQGVWLGQLAGDALGQLVEFRDADSIAREYPDGVRELVDGGTWNTLAGQPTDDSELATMLARSLVERGRYDREHVARRYAMWFASEPFDIGGTTTQAFGAAQRAVTAGGSAATAAEADANRASQANGALMRISPLAVFAAGAGWELETLVEFARSDARLSHPHAACADANAIFTAAIAHGIRNELSGAELTDWALERARSWTLDETVINAIEKSRDGAPPDFMTHQGWVLIALRNAFHQLRTARSLEAGVVDTVGRGGDTDTNAAIAGALLGAVHGRNGVPLGWQRALASCRPLRDSAAGAARPRPRSFWPVDAWMLAEAMLVAGRSG
jgi:ADP-ribosylglycohydrolase/fructose-1,6-bisphosphatase/inositol monophosphatase family enzyme